jgi:hypothetical protein
LLACEDLFHHLLLIHHVCKIRLITVYISHLLLSTRGSQRTSGLIPWSLSGGNCSKASDQQAWSQFSQQPYWASRSERLG